MQWQGSIAEREADIRSKNKAGRRGRREKRKSGRRDDTRWGRRRVCISRQRKMRAEGEGEKACSTRVSLIAFISKRGVRSLLSDIITQVSARRGNTGSIASTHTHTPVLDLFRSSIILFYFLVRHCLARSYLLIYRPLPPRPRCRFIFIYEPMPSIPFYLSSFFFFCSLRSTLLWPSSSRNHYRRIE